MASFTRRNAWKDGGTFDNLDLLWYAKGVGVMQSRALEDPNSWWFFAAIHGQFVIPDPNMQAFPGWGFIPGPPQVPTTPLPSEEVRNRYWDQCQHQSWFFPPWHRGYLIALEAQIRKAVIDLGGPANWALPYWNYFGPDDQFRIPPAFTAQSLPDGSANPLFVNARFGPDIQRYGDIFVVKDTSGTPANPNGASAVCQNNTVYTGFNAVTASPGYGGSPTGFWHGRGINGNLENNPHNSVHGYVGGLGLLRTLFSVGLEFVNELDAGQLSAALRNVFQQNGIVLSSQAVVQIIAPGNIWIIGNVDPRFFILNHEITGMLDIGNNIVGGLMSNPGTAALDPIFYLHHANIDRMWAAWNESNSNTTNEFWVNGPAAIGQREFVMPMPDGSEWVYTPTKVNSLSQLDFAYDDLDDAISPQPSNMHAERLMKLGVAPAVAETAQGENMDGEANVELLGANDRALQITGSGARTTVRLDTDVRGKVFASLASARDTSSPDRIYLHLENVRGTIDAFELNIVVNQQNVGTVALFGLQRASIKDGPHGGAGLAFLFDITDIMDNLFVANELDVDSIDVRIEPNNALADLAQITIGRVSVYRQGV